MIKVSPTLCSNTATDLASTSTIDIETFCLYSW